jgi:hypothetical protein
LNSEIEAVHATRRSHDWIQALYDTGPPAETRLLVRGEFERPGDVVAPGTLSALSPAGAPPQFEPAEDASGSTSGRRLALARWLTAAGTPAEGLVARVAVNRVWHHLLGRGIVATPGNLGLGGEPPTHPELLDWLASQLVRGGWKLKPLVRLIMTSTVYRLVSADTELSKRAQDVDPNGELFWRMGLRRLEAEIVRDLVLATSGKLDRTRGGPPVPLEVRDDGEVAIATQGLPTPTSQWQRSLYILSRRNYHPTFLGSFDLPVMSTNCTRRDPSTVVTQSLTLLNDQFMLEQAEHFAQRVIRETNGSAQSRIERAFQLAYSGKPTPHEFAWAATLLLDQAANYRAAGESGEKCDQKALASLCHMLLCSNQFLYVE